MPANLGGLNVRGNGALYRAMNPVGFNNAGGGLTTDATFGAEAYIFIRPSTGQNLFRLGAGGQIGASISVAGPAVGGRDQAAAFPNDSTLHFYTITDGTQLRAIWSLSPPINLNAVLEPVSANVSGILLGPTLPTGYFHWCYMGAFQMTGASLHRTLVTPGGWTYINPDGNGAGSILPGLNLVTNGGGGAFTTAPVNPFGSTVRLRVRGELTTNAGGAAISQLNLNALMRPSNNNTRFLQMQISVPGALQQINDDEEIDWPVSPASYDWLDIAGGANIATRSADINQIAFLNPYMMSA